LLRFQELRDNLQFKIFHATSLIGFSTCVTAFAQVLASLEGGKIILASWESTEWCKNMLKIVLISEHETDF
jgi:hypothetical protein